MLSIKKSGAHGIPDFLLEKFSSLIFYKKFPFHASCTAFWFWGSSSEAHDLVELFHPGFCQTRKADNCRKTWDRNQFYSIFHFF